MAMEQATFSERGEPRLIRPSLEESKRRVLWGASSCRSSVGLPHLLWRDGAQQFRARALS